MKPSEKIFIDFYQYPVFLLGSREDESMISAFNINDYPCDENCDKNALEAAWRLGNSGVADLGPKILENNPFFLNLASVPSFHRDSNWMLVILDPTQFAIDLQEKYQLSEFGDFNPEFFKELCLIFEENGVGFDVPCPYTPNWENQGKYPWPYPSKPGGFKK